jgi:hypothetical protein
VSPAKALLEERIVVKSYILLGVHVIAELLAPVPFDPP